MRTKLLLLLTTLLQVGLGYRVIRRLLATAGGQRIASVSSLFNEDQGALSVIVPVLNEFQRLLPCLEGLMAQGQDVAEILVVDGGSCDGTQELVRRLMARDSRIRLLNASPVPAAWNGKAWGLHMGLHQAAPATRWILTIDADVRPAFPLVRSLLAHADKNGLAALSVATPQEIAGAGQGLLHPSLLSTLVYRSGMPGKTFSRVDLVQANGQCFLVERVALEQCGGFESTKYSLCEDVTLARTLVAHGYTVGFYEADRRLLRVRMYENWRETWRNWTRSLPMRDRFSGLSTLVSWLEVLFVQALPLPLCAWLISKGRHRWLLLLNACGVALRLGVLFGTARAYVHRPWSYWLSPLCDLPVACKLGLSTLQRRHTWRGRIILRGGAE